MLTLPAMLCFEFLEPFGGFAQPSVEVVELELLGLNFFFSVGGLAIEHAEKKVCRASTKSDLR